MRLGIDFGTCFSSAALVLDEAMVRVKNPMGSGFSVPSSVFVPDQSDLLVGQAAENARRRDPARYQSEFKRDLGRTIPYQLGGRTFLPEMLVAEVLHKLKHEADLLLAGRGREPLTAATLTVPATYQEHKRGLMEQAAHAAGFAEVLLLEEPVAAARSYGWRAAPTRGTADGGVVLVYDLGGGTFDAALLRQQGTDYTFLAPRVGLERCGGVDFDRAIYQDLVRRGSAALREVLQPAPADDDGLLRRTLVADFCRTVKHQLSEAETADDVLVLPGLVESYSLTRTSFEGLIAPHVERTLEACAQLLASAGLESGEVDRVLLVGGSCRIPYVGRALEERFGRPVVRADDLELVVCEGAALYDAMPKGTRAATPTAAEVVDTVGEALDALRARAARRLSALDLDSLRAEAAARGIDVETLRAEAATRASDLSGRLGDLRTRVERGIASRRPLAPPGEQIQTPLPDLPAAEVRDSALHPPPETPRSDSSSRSLTPGARPCRHCRGSGKCTRDRFGTSCTTCLTRAGAMTESGRIASDALGKVVYTCSFCGGTGEKAIDPQASARPCSHCGGATVCERGLLGRSCGTCFEQAPGDSFVKVSVWKVVCSFCQGRGET